MNASPSLTASDKIDWVLKTAMLEVRVGRRGEGDETGLRKARRETATPNNHSNATSLTTSCGTNVRKVEEGRVPDTKEEGALRGLKCWAGESDMCGVDSD